MSAAMISCPVPPSLVRDWLSRGVIGNEWDKHKVYQRPGSRFELIAPAEALRGLRDDAEWLLDPAMGQPSGFKAVCRRFVDAANAALEAAGEMR